MFETFEHTADVGLRIRAPGLEELFREAGRALAAQLVEDPGAVGVALERSVQVAAERLDDLLFDWLCEILFLFDTEGFVPREFEVELGEGCVRGTLRGARFDPDRHAGKAEVKAITYHGLRVEREPGGGYLAEVILDL